MANIDEIIAQRLNDEGICTYNEQGADLFIGPPRPPYIASGVVLIPERSAWIILTGGPEPGRVFNQDYALHYTAVQIIVRGQPNQYIDGRDFAQTIWDELEGTQFVDNYNFLVLAREERPIFINYDENARPMWSMNFNVIYSI
jgi:hypothetical protein